MLAGSVVVGGVVLVLVLAAAISRRGDEPPPRWATRLGEPFVLVSGIALWDTPNVFVTGAALFPQNPGANPTGTVGALALRTADALRSRYFDAPGELL